MIGAAGDALFANLPLLFAVGIAIGMAKKADGSTALAAVVGYLVFKGVGDAMSPLVLGAPAEGEQELINYGVLGGIVIGLVSGVPLAALPPDQAAAVPRLLRRPPVRPDHHRVRRDRDLGADGLVYPAFDARHHQPRRVGHRQLRPRRLRLRHRSTGC